MRRALLFLPLLAACAPGTNNLSTTQSISVRENMPEGFAPWSDTPAPYRFGSGDRVKVQFLLTPELNETVLVSPDGSISLRAAGRVETAGRTTEEVAAHVTRASRASLTNPIVTVGLEEAGAAVAFVGGSVKRAGAYPVQGRRGVAEMITLAGGLEDFGRMDQVVLIRRSADNRPMLRTVDLRGFMSGADISADVPLTAGDIVFVPRTRIAEVGLWVNQAINQTIPFALLFLRDQPQLAGQSVLTMEEVLLLAQSPVTPLDAEAATALIAARDPALPLGFVVSINAQIMILASRPETGLAPAHAKAWLRLNDSRVLAGLHRRITGGSVAVAAGSDITQRLLESVIRPADPITIIGGGPMLLPALREKFGLERVMQHEPPMGYIHRPEARAAAIRFAQKHPARFTFVATGAPRSEILLAAMQEAGGVTGVGLAVGSGLLFAVDLTPRAPAWMQRNGLEWLHRAWSEPMRLGRRYVQDLPPLLRLTWRAWRQQRGRAT